MSILILFAFLSGVVTIFAPCIWPILPIVLSGSAAGGERRPIGLVAGLATSFMLATLALAYLIQITPFDPEILRTLSVAVIALLGLSLVIPALGAKLEGVVSRFASLGGRFTGNAGSGFGGGFVTGFALGLVWSPCAGPILATIATLAATQAVSFQVVIVTFSFVLGVALPLFILALLGQRVLAKTRAFSRYTRAIQAVFGVIMILAALAIYTGFDKTLQTQLLDTFPRYERFLNGLEKNEAVQEKLDDLKNGGESKYPTDRPKPGTEAKNTLKNYGPAPEIVGIEHWLNTETEESLAGLRGKVVLIDFWTYSCINCIRTLPYVTDWYDKYRDQGFVVIGIHTPEFAFEQKTENVAEAIERYGIHYPVAQDNRYATWQAYSNRYWPAHYLIDAEGNIRAYHFGEGNYAETEEAIRSLLEETGAQVGRSVSDVPDTLQSLIRRTPETYLGSDRVEYFVSPETITGMEQLFTEPSSIPLDRFSLSGRWRIDPERAMALGDSQLRLHFRGEKVHLVLAPPAGVASARARVFLDGQAIGAAAGVDVSDGAVEVLDERLYDLVDLHGDSGEHVLMLQFETPGMSAYAFTFS